MKKTILIILMGIVTVQFFGQHTKRLEMVKVNGIDMYYEVYGQGKPLVLLHGWTQSSGFWEDYIPAYAKHFKVYAIDLRGHGSTSPLTDDFSIKKSAGDILALLDHLKIKKVNAIGLSFGGLTLLELARSNPQRIASAILIGTSPRYHGGENNEGDKAFSFENLPSSYVQQLKRIHHQGEDQIEALFDPGLDYQIDLSNEELKSFHFRTLIVHGDRDEIFGVAPAFTLHEYLPDSALWIVPNTGHIAITGPNQKAFLATSLQFLRLDQTNQK